jgi:hypothetical protein
VIVVRARIDARTAADHLGGIAGQRVGWRVDAGVFEPAAASAAVACIVKNMASVITARGNHQCSSH